MEISQLVNTDMKIAVQSFGLHLRC